VSDGPTTSAEDGYDVVILGAGSGGYACALRSAELGQRVALIEQDKVGGTCLHRGCIPTKALLHAAEIADQARAGAVFGVPATVGDIDVAALRAYQDAVVSQLWKGLTGLVASRRIDVFKGAGRLASPTEVRVGDRLIGGRHVVLATGARPRTLPGLPIDGERVITSEHALTLDRVPASAVVLGGGVIGVEFASAWRSLGAEVTIVEALPHLLPGEEESSSRWLERAFRKRGIRFELGATIEDVKDDGDGVTVTLAGGTTVAGELLLVAVGREPVSAGLGFEEAEVAVDRGLVTIDEHCQTSAATISAVGDLTPGPQLAHVGFAQGILAAEKIAGRPVRAIDYDGVPRITYSDPEVASVGLTSATAAARGIETVQVRYPLGGNGRSVILHAQGEARVIAAAPADGDDQPGPVLGIHLVGARVGELIAEAQLICNWKAAPAEVAQLIHPHPSQSEIIGETSLALAGKPLHFHG
jgi:dihydrolipoamide dehydrogenase